jgi:hypothetical protein
MLIIQELKQIVNEKREHFAQKILQTAYGMVSN